MSLAEGGYWVTLRQCVLSVSALTPEPSKVIVCVSVISGRLRIIARMPLMGF